MSNVSIIQFLLENMALHKSITMSSTHTSFQASYCNDGVIGQMCHTWSSLTGWVRIDLGGRQIVTCIIIHNRITTDLALRRRLSNTDLYVFDNEDPNDNRRLCAHIEDGEPLEVFARCTKPLFARNVELLQPSIGVNRAINICEISVY